MLAEYLDLPFVPLASKLELAGSSATVERDIEGGVEVLECNLPLVVSASKGMAEQRIPNMRGIMMARTKPLQVVQPVDFEEPVEAVRFTLPPVKAGVKLVDPEQMDELVRLLHEEAKVL
jgi:electron transfer flavoprotein beta subunit